MLGEPDNKMRAPEAIERAAAETTEKRAAAEAVERAAATEAAVKKAAAEAATKAASAEVILTSQKMINRLHNLPLGSALPLTDLNVAESVRKEGTGEAIGSVLHESRDGLYDVHVPCRNPEDLPAVRQFRHIESLWLEGDESLHSLTHKLRDAYERNPHVLPADVVLKLQRWSQAVEDFLENMKGQVDIIRHGRGTVHSWEFGTTMVGGLSGAGPSRLSLANDTTLRNHSSEAASRGLTTKALTDHSAHPAAGSPPPEPVISGTTTRHRQSNAIYRFMVHRVWYNFYLLSSVTLALYAVALSEGFDPARVHVAEKLNAFGDLVAQGTSAYLGSYPLLEKNLNRGRSIIAFFKVVLFVSLLVAVAAVPPAFWPFLVPVSRFLSSVVGFLLNGVFAVIVTDTPTDDETASMEMGLHAIRESHRTAAEAARDTEPGAPPLTEIGSQHHHYHG